MSGGLPAFIEPRRLAERCQALRGTLPLARFRRLAGCLADAEGRIKIELDFAREAPGRAVVRGSVRAELRLVCQRCLEPLPTVLQTPVSLVVVGSQAEADRLEEGEDPLVVGEEPVSLVELVEDELLLALPQAPTHPWSVCGGVVEAANAPVADQGRLEGAGPFAGLAGLTRKTPGDA